MKICFCGPQSCGKTTILREIKSYYPNALYVEEVIRGLNRKINLEASSETQLLIFLKHCQNLFEKNELVFYDRGIIDSVAYARVSCGRNKLSPDILTIGENLLDDLKNEYDLYFYFPPNIPLVYDGIRSIDESYRNEAHEAYTNIFKEKNIDYYPLTGSISDRIQFIDAKIKEYK